MAERPPAGIPDRRKRHEVRHLAFGVRASVGAVEAHVKDVSRSGMGVEVPEALRVGRTMTVTVKTEHSSVDVTGVVRWCRMEIKKGPDGQTTTVYGAGMKFEDLPVEKIEKLEQVTKLPLTAAPAAGREPEPAAAPTTAGFDLKRS